MPTEDGACHRLSAWRIACAVAVLPGWFGQIAFEQGPEGHNDRQGLGLVNPSSLLGLFSAGTHLGRVGVANAPERLFGNRGPLARQDVVEPAPDMGPSQAASTIRDGVPGVFTRSRALKPA
ncbi:MAG: hypothetical protein AAGI50_10775 [Pseudomonadota bacterium]